MSEELERIIRPIVEGQLKTFALSHPALVESVDWGQHKGDTKLDSFVNSGSKRITRALLCTETIARLRSALSGQNED